MLISCCPPLRISPSNDDLQEMQTISGDFNDQFTSAQCLEWISLRVKENNTKQLPSDRVCEYKTPSGKTKRVHASHLFYEDVTGALVNSGICRSQAPVDIKEFFSWIIRKGEQERRQQNVFNLIHGFDYVHHSDLNTYLISDEYQGKKSRIKIKVLDEKSVGGDVNKYTLQVEKIRDSIGKYQKEPQAISETVVKVSQFGLWPDAGVIDIHVLEQLVSVVIVERSEQISWCFHCVAGKGRSGVMTVAVLLYEAIKGNVNTLGIDVNNYKNVICKLIVSLRCNGGGDHFVQTMDQLALLFDYAELLLEIWRPRSVHECSSNCTIV